nr:MAG TPA: peptidase [Caudoviricetes sp.]
MTPTVNYRNDRLNIVIKASDRLHFVENQPQFVTIYK